MEPFSCIIALLPRGEHSFSFWLKGFKKKITFHIQAQQRLQGIKLRMVGHLAQWLINNNMPDPSQSYMQHNKIQNQPKLTIMTPMVALTHLSMQSNKHIHLILRSQVFSCKNNIMPHLLNAVNFIEVSKLYQPTSSTNVSILKSINLRTFIPQGLSTCINNKE